MVESSASTITQQLSQENAGKDFIALKAQIVPTLSLTSMVALLFFGRLLYWSPLSGCTVLVQSSWVEASCGILALPQLLSFAPVFPFNQKFIAIIDQTYLPTKGILSILVTYLIKLISEWITFNCR